jgi:regulatory protein
MAVERKYPPLKTAEEIRKWCDRQERCHKEVRTKLASWGVYGAEPEQLISDLISSNHLNEERFAMAFARGKFRIKKWGWQKIQYELKSRGISAYCINKAREELGGEDMDGTLQVLLSRKKENISRKGINTMELKSKLFRFAYAKGYSSDEIKSALELLLRDGE